MKYEVNLPPASPIAADSYGNILGSKLCTGATIRPIFFGFLFYCFWILSFHYSLPFLLSFSISFYSPLLISSYSSRLGTILRLLFLLLLYFKLFVDLQTCILMIYHMYSIVHISVIRGVFRRGQKPVYLLILLYCTMFFLFLFFSSYI
jgi:hypothetical protein